MIIQKTRYSLAVMERVPFLLYFISFIVVDVFYILLCIFWTNSKKLPTVGYRRRRKQTKRLEMPFLKTDISWQLGVIGSVYPPIADIFSLLLDWIGVRKINLIFPWLFCHLLKKFISHKRIFFPTAQKCLGNILSSYIFLDLFFQSRFQIRFLTGQRGKTL